MCLRLRGVLVGFAGAPSQPQPLRLLHSGYLSAGNPEVSVAGVKPRGGGAPLPGQLPRPVRLTPRAQARSALVPGALARHHSAPVQPAFTVDVPSQALGRMHAPLPPTTLPVAGMGHYLGAHDAFGTQVPARDFSGDAHCMEAVLNAQPEATRRRRAASAQMDESDDDGACSEDAFDSCSWDTEEGAPAAQPHVPAPTGLRIDLPGATSARRHGAGGVTVTPPGTPVLPTGHGGARVVTPRSSALGSHSAPPSPTGASSDTGPLSASGMPTLTVTTAGAGSVALALPSASGTSGQGGFSPQRSLPVSPLARTKPSFGLLGDDEDGEGDGDGAMRTRRRSLSLSAKASALRPHTALSAAPGRRTLGRSRAHSDGRLPTTPIVGGGRAGSPCPWDDTPDPSAGLLVEQAPQPTPIVTMLGSHAGDRQAAVGFFPPNAGPHTPPSALDILRPDPIARHDVQVRQRQPKAAQMGAPPTPLPPAAQSIAPLKVHSVPPDAVPVHRAHGVQRRGASGRSLSSDPEVPVPLQPASPATRHTRAQAAVPVCGVRPKARPGMGHGAYAIPAHALSRSRSAGVSVGGTAHRATPGVPTPPPVVAGVQLAGAAVPPQAGGGGGPFLHASPTTSVGMPVQLSPPGGMPHPSAAGAGGGLSGFAATTVVSFPHVQLGRPPPPLRSHDASGQGSPRGGERRAAWSAEPGNARLSDGVPLQSPGADALAFEASHGLLGQASYQGHVTDDDFFMALTGDQGHLMSFGPDDMHAGHSGANAAEQFLAH